MLKARIKPGKIVLSLLAISVGLNLYFYFGDAANHDSSQGNVESEMHSHGLANMPSKHNRNSIALLENSRTEPGDVMIARTSSSKSAGQDQSLQPDSVSSPENAQVSGETEASQAYYANFEQEKENAYHEIEFILQQASARGVWDETDQYSFQKYARYVDANMIAELIQPFMERSADMDMRVPLDLIPISYHEPVQPPA